MVESEHARLSNSTTIQGMICSTQQCSRTYISGVVSHCPHFILWADKFCPTFWGTYPQSTSKICRDVNADCTLVPYPFIGLPNTGTNLVATMVRHVERKAISRGKKSPAQPTLPRRIPLDSRESIFRLPGNHINIWPSTPECTLHTEYTSLDMPDWNRFAFQDYAKASSITEYHTMNLTGHKQEASF
jgi:hypothetical protein